MIKARVENAAAYAVLGPGMRAAMEWLQRREYAGLAPGRYELNGGSGFVVLERYRPKPLEQAAWETHRNYIDVQLVIEGRERMGCCPLASQPPVIKPYDPATDLEFYSARGDLFEFGPGEFAVFTPHDVHAPKLAPSGPVVDVFKAVIKIPVDPANPCGF